jgi:nucleotide-binding universal stress UspA family protein
LLTQARVRAAAAGVALLDGRLRHGEFVPTLQEMEPDARLFVLGEHYHAAHSSKVYLDHRVEQVIRGTRRSVLVATRAQFTPPARFAVAFDGSASAFKTIEAVKASTLLSGMSVRLFMAGAEAPQRLRLLEEARQALATAGFDVMAQFSKGEPHVVLPALVLQHDVHLLVIGAFGHSWLRQLVSGSTTSTLLRVSDVPVLVLR